MVKRAKLEEWEMFRAKIKKDSKDNQKLFHKVLKDMRGKRKANSRRITDRNEEVLIEPQDIVQRWKKYFMALLESSNGNGK